MALHDLTPQLRTRLSRMERAVGLFVVIAAGLLLFGFAYYIYNTAERKGWFKAKAPYFTFIARATGLKVGDPVKLMGFDVGEITEITAMPAEQFTYNVYVEFQLKEPFFDYMWTDGSLAKVTTADLLGKRVLEVTKGTGGYPTYVFFLLRTNVPITQLETMPDLTNWALAQEIYEPGGTGILATAWGPLTNLSQIAAAGYERLAIMNKSEKRKSITGIWDYKEARYEPYSKKSSKPYWLVSEESAAVTERLEKLVEQVEMALPGIFSLTNQLGSVLSNGASLTSNLNVIALEARPVVSNLTAVTAQLDHPGALGEWLLPTNIHQQLEGLLSNAKGTFASADTNLTALAENLGRSLDNLANLTSNLNTQVQANTNLVSSISRTIVDADELIQGLKRHWFLRSAFKPKKPAKTAPPAPAPPVRSPKEKGQR